MTASLLFWQNALPLLALDCILERGIKRASIFSDFYNVMETVSNVQLDGDPSYLILALKNKLKSALLQSLDITLVWILSHVEILGNETVDFLAREAARNGETISIISLSTLIFTR